MQKSAELGQNQPENPKLIDGGIKFSFLRNEYYVLQKTWFSEVQVFAPGSIQIHPGGGPQKNFASEISDF